MRGDSIRDFYAKTLALVGLGMLAGVGAIVDRWPSAPQFVAVPSPVRQSALVAPKPPVAPEPLPAPAERSTARLKPAIATLDPVADVGLPTEQGVASVEPVSASADVADVLPEVPLAVVAAADLAGTEVSLAEPELMAYDTAAAMQAAPVARAEENGGLDGAIVGAFKRTGSSIAKGSAKTGASVVEVVRIMTGVVRKALPN